MQTDHDVVILGGGLAGGLLLRQLRLQRPDLRVLACERSRTTSFKVGEATVELFSNYLLRRLGLSTYLYEHHLPKNGLRFFFDTPARDTPLLAMSEIGSQSLPYHPSFQLDRSALERELRDGAARLGGELLEGAKVTAVELGEPHRVTFVDDGGRERTVRARWVVDATGRTSLLAKQLALRTPVQDHRCLAAWARVRDLVDLDGAAIDAGFRDRVRHTSRRLSTVHFVHRGYWIWLIPLRGGITSVGVVGDHRRLSREVLTADGLRTFLHGHRALGELLAPAQWLDFGGYGQLAYGTKQWFGDRWAVVGEAAAFSDPFYSPGSDFITLANDFTADLIGRDADGEDVAERRRLYDGYLQYRYAANLPLYRDQYELFGSFDLLRARWDFDVASYYNLWLESWLQDQHLDVGHLRQELRQRPFVVRALERFGALFAAAERAVTARGDYERHNLGRFAEGLGSIGFVRELGRRDRATTDAESLRIFALARERCFELLGKASGGERLGFADFVTGRAMAGVLEGS
ncbi:MAG: tryptophan 7-halogenase [Planctomycetes bacterium]|nr:tryptophan 7-halogenase [Planctomycetota bacterium]